MMFVYIELMDATLTAGGLNGGSFSPAYHTPDKIEPNVSWPIIDKPSAYF